MVPKNNNLPTHTTRPCLCGKQPSAGRKGLAFTLECCGLLVTKNTIQEVQYEWNTKIGEILDKIPAPELLNENGLTEEGIRLVELVFNMAKGKLQECFDFGLCYSPEEAERLLSFLCYETCHQPQLDEVRFNNIVFETNNGNR